MLYARAFFKDKSLAKKFQKRVKGELLCGLPGSPTKRAYEYESFIGNRPSDECKKRPYCVVYHVIPAERGK